MRPTFAFFTILMAMVPASLAAETAKGFVTKLDAAARTVELRTEDGAKTLFTLKPDAELLFRDRKIRFDEVRTGDRVEVTYENVAGKKLAAKLVIVERPFRAMADSPSRSAPTTPRPAPRPARPLIRTMPSSATPPESGEGSRLLMREDAGAFWRQRAYYATDRKPLGSLGRPFPMLFFLLVSLGLGGLGLVGWLVGGQERWKRIRSWGGVAILVALTIAGMALFSAWWQGPTSDLPGGVSFGKERSDELRFGQAWVSIPKTHETGELERPSVLRLEFKPDPAKHIALLENQALSRPDWLLELAAAVANSPRREIFVFIHGYNVNFEDALRRTGQLAFDLQLEGPAVLFSWPSQAGVAPYTVDENYADLATDHFQSVLQDLANETGAATVHVLAHSMGNRVLAETLARLADQKAAWLPRKLGEIVMAAPDVDRDKFRVRYHPLLKDAGRRLTLYASAKDRALLASRFVHGNPRAGDAGPNLLILEKMDSIDVSKVDTSFLGHSYYGDRPELIDDLRSILDGASPPQRDWLIRQLMENLPYWEMKARGGDL